MDKNFAYIVKWYNESSQLHYHLEFVSEDQLESTLKRVLSENNFVDYIYSDKEQNMVTYDILIQYHLYNLNFEKQNHITDLWGGWGF